MTIEINKERIIYLLDLFKMSESELIDKLNKGRKKKLLTKEDVITPSIDSAVLKRIDSIFKKGLLFYYDFFPIKKSAETSILFRKAPFETNPNNETIRIVDKFEGLKNRLDSYSILSKDEVIVKSIKYTTDDDPCKVANAVRTLFLPTYTKDHKLFLRNMIDKCSDCGIYVFEFVESWNKKEKANIDGAYISPNMIVLKHQKWTKREIFTLAHEIGHFLLNIDEIESVDIENLQTVRYKKKEENWCNDFAFYLIAGKELKYIDELGYVDASNDYCHKEIKQIAERNSISRLSLFTHLLRKNKITVRDYMDVCHEINQQFKDYEKRKKIEERDKRKGFGPVKPIISKLYTDTLKLAFYNGLINEYSFCQELNIKPQKLDKYL